MIMKTLNLIFILLICMGHFSCKKENKCPYRIYPQQKSFVDDEKLKAYKPYVDIVNSLGTFWIESISDEYNTIFIHCSQIYNGLLIDLPVGFNFYTGELAERIKKEGSDYFEQDGIIYFVGGAFTPKDTPVESEPEITIETAIRIALSEQPLEEFCRYELCYYHSGRGMTPWLSWKLYGKRYTAYISTQNGFIIGIYDQISD